MKKVVATLGLGMLLCAAAQAQETQHTFIIKAGIANPSSTENCGSEGMFGAEYE